jgi:hypothetical protein
MDGPRLHCRCQAFHAKQKRRDIASLRQVDALTGQGFSLTFQEPWTATVALWRVPFGLPEGLPDRPLRNSCPRCFPAPFSASATDHSAAIGKRLVTAPRPKKSGQHRGAHPLIVSTAVRMPLSLARL